MSERTITVTDAARNFADLINRVVYRNESALLVKNGVPVARVVPVRPARITGRELAEVWRAIPEIPEDDRESFARDIEAARESVLPPRDPWAL